MHTILQPACALSSTCPKFSNSAGKPCANLGAFDSHLLDKLGEDARITLYSAQNFFGAYPSSGCCSTPAGTSLTYRCPGIGTAHAGSETAKFLLERALIHTHHGLDSKARADIDKAAAARNFKFALTGKLGKRTKFQERDISQLVIIAKSADNATDTNVNSTSDSEPSGPKNLDLNDDTLLESEQVPKLHPDLSRAIACLVNRQICDSYRVQRRQDLANSAYASPESLLLAHQGKPVLAREETFQQLHFR